MSDSDLHEPSARAVELPPHAAPVLPERTLILEFSRTTGAKVRVLVERFPSEPGSRRGGGERVVVEVDPGAEDGPVPGRAPHRVRLRPRELARVADALASLAPKRGAR